MPKCESTTHPSYWWRPNQIEFKNCTRNASVNIAGINLCLQHAGAIAVQKLIAKGECIKLDSANPNGPLCNLEDRWAKYVKD